MCSTVIGKFFSASVITTSLTHLPLEHFSSISVDLANKQVLINFLSTAPIIVAILALNTLSIWAKHKPVNLCINKCPVSEKTLGLHF